MATIREILKKDGTSSFHVEIRLKGHPSERASFRNKSLAKKWIQDTESAIRDGRHFKTVESKKHTVGEMIEKFIKQWLSKYPHRQKKQASYLDWWNKKYGYLLLSDFTAAVIAEGRDQLLGGITRRGGLRNPSTCNRYLSALGKALTVAVKEWAWLEDSPMRNVTKPSEGEGRERFLSAAEADLLLQECRKSRNPNLLPIVSIALITGMRSSEITGLRWRDINFEQRSITLCRTKNGDRRVIPLTDEAVAIFHGCQVFGVSPDEFVFQSDRNVILKQKVSIREAFENAVVRSGIEHCRFHDLRHTAASNMAMSGATQGELMAILGHRSPNMTRRYAHYSQDHLKTVLDRVKSSENKNSKEKI